MVIFPSMYGGKFGSIVSWGSEGSALNRVYLIIHIINVRLRLTLYNKAPKTVHKYYKECLNLLNIFKFYPF
jgi:hypothetical protein